jgi:hypothetical protein
MYTFIYIHVYIGNCKPNPRIGPRPCACEQVRDPAAQAPRAARILGDPHLAPPRPLPRRPAAGKTLVAKRLARTSGLDFAILSGGDVAPLEGKAVTQLHETFDWAERSRR